MRFYLFVYVIALCMVLSGCSNRWADDAYWYQSAVDVEKADVFYVVSTEILEKKNDEGKNVYVGELTDIDKKFITMELDYAHDMFGDSLNFFSPYYRQFAMNTLKLPEKEMMKLRAKASKDAVKAFRYYIRHKNNGRPFILAGFSQGGMHLVDIVRTMKKKDYERMAVAYSMGYRLSADDMKHPNVKAAQSADDCGAIVSFNSVVSPKAMWDIVNGDAATCINPINYCTDQTPATFVFENDTLQVHVDTRNNVLIVNSPRIDSYRFPVLDDYCKPGNLHHWDLLFYKDAIRHNALRRVAFLQKLKVKS